MNTNEKFRLEQQTKRNYWLLRFKTGCKVILNEKDKRYIIIGYVVLALVLWCFRVPLFRLGEDDIFGAAKRVGFENLFRVGSAAGFVGLLMRYGMPFGGKSIHDNLRRIGFVNSAGECPLLVAARKDKDNLHVEILEFEANGIPLTEWESKRAKIEAALNVHTVKIKEGANKRRILLYTVPAGSGLSQVLYWNDEYLSADSFSLVMGESLTGRVTVNLAQIPHILLGGSTGSGKSVLLKLLLMQCMKKGATVYIADFKGGVDFPALWHDKCRIIVDENTLLKTLSGVVDELERRKRQLKVASLGGVGVDVERG